ncbi:MAG: ABC transporter substrate-binding protein [Anaerolineae bacterium]
MPRREVTRRSVLIAAAGGTAAVLAACGATPTPQVIKEVVTQVVEKEVTKIVEGTPQVVKETVVVEQTVVVEKEITAPAVASGDVQTIRAMHRGGQPQVDELQQGIDRFNEQFAGKWQAEMEFVETGYNEKLLTLIAGQTLPDVFYMNAEVLPSFAYRGAFYDLNPLDELDHTTADYWPELVEMSRYEGKLCGLPKDYSPYVMWVNLDRFEEAGVDLPTADWTWQDIIEKAQQLTVGEGDQIEQYGLYGYSWFTAMWQNGGDFFNADYTQVTINTPETAEAIQWVADHNLTYKVAPIAQAITESGQDTYQWFGTGRIAMYFMGRWAVPYLRALEGVNWDCFPLPMGTQAANVFLQSGPAVASTTKLPEAGWEFCKIWTGPDGQSINIDTGVSIPTVNTGSVRESYLNATPPSVQGNQVFYDAIPIGHPLPTTGTFSWLEISQVMTPELDLVWTGDQTAEEALVKVEPLLQDLMTQS